MTHNLGRALCNGNSWRFCMASSMAFVHGAWRFMVVAACFACSRVAWRRGASPSRQHAACGSAAAISDWTVGSPVKYRGHFDQEKTLCKVTAWDLLEDAVEKRAAWCDLRG